MSLPDRDLTLIETLRYFKSGELSELAAEDCIKAIMLVQLKIIEDAANDKRVTTNPTIGAVVKAVRENISKL